MQNHISAGSYSRLAVYERCPYAAQLAFVNKIPKPDRGPLPPHLNEWPDKRGIRIHEAIENYLKNDDCELPKEAKFFSKQFSEAKKKVKEGKAVGEDLWNFDENWKLLPNPFASNPTDWETFYKVRFRIKSDLFIKESEDNTATIVDYKTGKVQGNEVKHAEQLELYALGAFCAYPLLSSISAQIWYLDERQDKIMLFFREESVDNLLEDWTSRNNEMLLATKFPPNPSANNCRWCDYRNNNPCTVGV